MIQKYFILLVTGLLMSGVTFSQTSWYVSKSGSDSNSGTIDSPLLTVQAGLNKMNTADVLYIREGIYRELAEAKKNKIKILAYPGEKPVVKGSDVMTGWETNGSYWKIFVDVQPQQVFVDGNNPLQQIGIPSKYFAPGSPGASKKYQSQVGTDIKDMAAGRFWWQNDTLYIWLDDSSDPNQHEIEVSQRKNIMLLDNVDGVYVKGVQFEHSNGNTFREQPSAVKLGNNCVLDRCTVQWCDFAGVSMGYFKTGAKILNSQLLYNGALGAGASESYEFVISNTRMAYNNYRNFYSQWHAGGFKAATYAYGTIENCEVDNNNGGGIWFDYCFYSTKHDNGENLYPIIVRNNYLHNNGTGNYDRDDINNMASITIEASEQAYVYNNIIDTCEFRGVWLSSAWNSYFVNNVIAHGVESSYPYSIALDGGALYTDLYLKNNVIQNNILYKNKLASDIRMKKENGDKIKNNVCSNNTIFPDGRSVKLIYGSSTKRSIASWQSNTPYGQGSIDSDPQFAGSMFRLTDSSPCINTGQNVLEDTMLTDYFGNDRRLGLFMDMGVEEAAVGEDAEYDASLNSLVVSLGELNPGFAQTTFIYTDTLPDNTTQTPTVTAVPSAAGSSVKITNAKNVQATDEAFRTTKIKVTSENGIIEYTYKIIFYSEHSSGTSNFAESNFRLYPNPSDGVVYIENANNNQVDIKVLNISGEVITARRFEPFAGKRQIDLSNQPGGVYFMKIESENTSRTVKFIIQ